MIKMVIGILIYAFLVSGCALHFLGGPEGGSLVIVPALPLTVELDNDQYFVQNGYYYSYRSDIWFYSESRQGPWLRLPRSHYPKEVRYRRRDMRHHNGQHY